MELEQETIQELIVVIVDKGLLAIIIALTVFILNRLLEKYKSKLSRDNSLIKERFLSINETWKEIYYWIVESHVDYAPKIGQKESESERYKRFNKILENGEKVLKTIKKNRFINGTDFTQEMIVYVSKYYENYQKLKMNRPMDFDFFKLEEEGSDLMDKYNQLIDLKNNT